MGALNAAPTFVSMMMKLQMEWETLAQERRLKNLHQKILRMMCSCLEVQSKISRLISELI